MTKAIEEGLMERKADKDKRMKEEQQEKEEAEKIKTRTREELEQEIEGEIDVKASEKAEIKKLKDTEGEEKTTHKRPRKTSSVRKK
jgi:hypothetical protein